MRNTIRLRHTIRSLAMPACIAASLTLASVAASSADATSGSGPTEALLEGLRFRSIGPALQSGRIADLAIDPSQPDTWYVAAASGGVWKTVNHGTTWQPIFDHYGTYSIGCVTIDPQNPHVVWVGTGENNSQRSVGWGDGVYKSLDGGESFTNMGLGTSEHIGKIVLDPRDSDVVWVASQGPLWSGGGERGLYKSSDSGTTWQRVLHISDDTGVSDVVLDPRDPDTVYAASFQRRRRQWALVAGGLESAIHKSTDGGATWRTLERGLPDGPLGRIGLAISPSQPDVLYATIPGLPETQGFFRSENRGESWSKMSDWVAVDPQYYQELVPDPHRFGRVYAMDVFLQVTEDGGQSFAPVPTDNKHVDNHALVIDPQNADHLISGTDGGLYESYDRGATWRFVSNLPITQFYRIAVDERKPFYWVYGGTQDNDSVAGPSRTANVHGIRNSDWIHTSFGDGYQSRVDPDNADIVYSMWQYGELMRFDRLSGEMLDIKPQPDPGEVLTWNWDAPFAVSAHGDHPLYFAGNYLFRSDDRGASWTKISGNLTRGIDRNALPVMGRLWSVDAVWKNVFTSFYGNATALDESPAVPGLLYVGTDDGLIHVTEDGGTTWRRSERFPAVPENTLVADLTASRHDPNRVFALFNNHKSGDFTPYVLRSDDRGRSWRTIAGDLPNGDVAWALVEDPIDPEILFLGTEFGVWTRIGTGDAWRRLTGGMPRVAVRDLEIQQHADDLVVGTFGRGIYILDDISPLRHLRTAAEASTPAGTPPASDVPPARLLPTRDVQTFIPAKPMGWDEKGTQGDALFTAPNPPNGAVLTYVLHQDYRSLRDQRLAAEAELRAADQDVRYPVWQDLRAEDREQAPTVALVIHDDKGQQVARLAAAVDAGLHRTTWNLRRASLQPITSVDDNAWAADPPSGPPAPPGTYTATLVEEVGGVVTALAEPQSFGVWPLGQAALPNEDRQALAAFQHEVEELVGAVYATWAVLDESQRHVERYARALARSRRPPPGLAQRIHALRDELFTARSALAGDETVARRAEPTTASLLARLERVASVHWSSTSAPLPMQRQNLAWVSSSLAEVLDRLRPMVEEALPAIARELDASGAPWTPGSGLPTWPPPDRTSAGEGLR